jgi:uncharacterized protein (TIGR01777 family)
MATVVISGGSGMIGTALSHHLAANGYEIIILTRDPAKHRAKAHISYAAWDVEQKTIDESAIGRADYIVHLAGSNLSEGRWTAKRKKEILDSRVQSGELLVKAIREIPNQIKAVISSSAIGFYGPDQVVPNPHPFIETDQPAHDFLGSVVQQWEAAIQPVETMGKRLVIFRTGIVLSREGGAYVEFKKPLRFGLATVLGGGNQTVSWIHIDDLVRLYHAAIEHASWKGVYNAVSPQPVTNRQLVLAMAAARKKFYLTAPVPAFALKLVLGEMSVEVLKSTTVSSARLQQEGFNFLYPGIDAAMHALQGHS